METLEHTIGGVTFYGSLAETASQITPEEWAYNRFLDTLTDHIAEYMENVDMTKADLARKLGTSRAFVSKILAGDAHNMTLKTLSRVIENLDARLEFKIVPKHEIFNWIGVTRSTNKIVKPTPTWESVNVMSHCGLPSLQTGRNEKELIAA